MKIMQILISSILKISGFIIIGFLVHRNFGSDITVIYLVTIWLLTPWEQE